MIVIKSAREIELMKKAGAIAASALKLAGKMIAPGVNTMDIDKAVKKYIESRGAKPSFLNYNGYPASCCISVNNVVIHGIPSKKQFLKEGDIVSVDVGAHYKGYHGDCANTFACGNISEEAKSLIETTRQSFWEGMKFAKDGYRVGDVGYAVEEYCRQRGYGVVYEFTGHGVGAKLHEDPSVPNLGPAGHGPRLRKGMTIAVEPMINQGCDEVDILDDGWTTVTADGKLAAHYENTVLITDGEPIILTVADED